MEILHTDIKSDGWVEQYLPRHAGDCLPESDAGKILAIDRQTEVAVDLSENVAGKSAIQKATYNLAGRFTKKMMDNFE